MKELIDLIEKALADAGGSMSYTALVDALPARFRQRVLAATSEMKKMGLCWRETKPEATDASEKLIIHAGEKPQQTEGGE